MAFEAFAVAVKLSLVGNLATGLLGITKHLNTANTDAEKLQKNINSIGKQLAVGGVLFGGGVAIASLFKTPLDEAKKYQTEMAKFSLYGMSDSINSESANFVKHMNAMGTSINENMKLFTEAQGVFRESGVNKIDGAKIAAPILAKIAYATSGLSEESQAKMKTSSLAMLRYIEDSGGLKSPKRFIELADAGWKMTQTSGGSVDWEQLRQFKVRGGVAAMNLTDDAVAQFEPIITMLKGQTAGFSLRTAYNRLNGIIKIPNQVAHELVKNHIWDGNRIVWNSQGGIKAFKGNPLINADLFSSNSIDFYEKMIMPMHKRMGITSESAIAQSNAMIFGSTGGNMFTLIDKNIEKLHESLKSQHKALGIDDSVKKTDGTLAGQEVIFTAKWHDLMLNLGTVVLPLANEALEKINPMLAKTAEWMDKNQKLTKYFAEGLISISAVMIGGGFLNILAGSARGFKLLISVMGGKGLISLLTGLGSSGGNAGKGVKSAASALGDISTVANAGFIGRLFSISGAFKAIGAAAGLGGAWWLGTKVGEEINNQLPKGFKNKLGEYEAKAIALLGSDDAMDAVKRTEGKDSWFVRMMNQREYNASKQPPIATKQPITINVNNTTTLDGKVVAESVTKYQTKAAAKPSTGVSGYDYGMAPWLPNTPSFGYTP